MSKPEPKTLDASLVARVGRMTNQPDLPGAANAQNAARMAATQEWFGPLMPLSPVAQTQAFGRQFDYPVGFNLSYTPRASEPVSFAQMRGLADNYDLLRLLIETRKDQMTRLRWSVGPIESKSNKKAVDPRSQQVIDFFRLPDKRHNWQSWLRLLLEDLLVIDAATLLPTLTRGGQLYSLEQMDGSTIKPIIDAQGRRPMVPDPAYQQVLHGMPAVDYTENELLYLPRNIRTHKVYGFSPVEQAITTINIAHQIPKHQLNY